MTKSEYATQYGITVAADMFVDFINISNRGPRFEWRRYPDMAKRRASTNLMLNVPTPGPSEAEKSLAGEAAEAWAADAVRRAGLV